MLTTVIHSRTVGMVAIGARPPIITHALVWPNTCPAAIAIVLSFTRNLITVFAAVSLLADTLVAGDANAMVTTRWRAVKF